MPFEKPRVTVEPNHIISLDSLINPHELVQFHHALSRTCAVYEHSYNQLGELYPGYPYPTSAAANDWFHSLPPEHPARGYGVGMTDKQIKKYLAYLTESVPLTPIFRVYTNMNGEDSLLAPELRMFFDWIAGCGIFDTVQDAVLMPTQAGYATPIHRHDCNVEFIWVRLAEHKQFFVLDEATGDRRYLTGHIGYFNDVDWHGSDPCWNNTYSIRINGRFSEPAMKFIERINKDLRKADEDPRT